MSRAEVVLGFADSAEFRRDMMAETLGHSFAGLQAGWTDDVFRLFRATLDRSPAEAGLLDWAGRLAEGLSYTEAAAGIVNGAEFQARFGATTNAEFVTLLYGNVLDRAPDAGGLAAWTHALNAGMSRAEAVTRFASSAEFVRATKADLTVFMRGLGGDDTLRGGAGNDTLFGGALADSFVFDATEGGVDHIVDLEPWDSVVVENAPWSTPAQLFDALRQVGEDVVLDMGAAQIVLDRTDLADLTPDMFILQ